MTQKDLIKEWIEIHGSIVPAKMAGVVFMGHMFGSETSKRCREMRKEGELWSVLDGKFEKFYPEWDRPEKEERKVEVEPVEARLF